jgi:O-methyltransferase
MRTRGYNVFNCEHPMRHSLRRITKRIVPPLLLDAMRIAFGRSPAGIREYQGVSTVHDMSALHRGRFAESYDRHVVVDPTIEPDTMRLRTHFACLFAALIRRLDGDFLFGGINFGVTPRVVYDYLERDERPTRRYHLIDPFAGVDATGGVRASYNRDPERVRAQYPPQAPVVIWQEFMPDCFPLASVSHLAFVSLNTGVPTAEAASLAHVYPLLTPGGIIIIDAYAFGSGASRLQYDRAIEQLGACVSVLPTGQGVVFRPQ